jgi:hypothetical protein
LDRSEFEPFILLIIVVDTRISMAWIELRILVAKMVFLFDFELVDKETDWGKDASSMILWETPELITIVKLRELL